MSFLPFLFGFMAGLSFGVILGCRTEPLKRPENLAHQGYREVDADDETEGGVL